jgi:hypothetical protein
MKQSDYATVHSLPSSTKVKNVGRLSSTFPYAFMVHKTPLPVLSYYFTYNTQKMERPRWRSWLRHCAGSIPDGVSGFFHWHNPVGRTMAPGSTQPLTEMS